MQVNETLVRSVVEQVISRLGSNGAAVPVVAGSGYRGRFGLFDCVDEFGDDLV